jgi:hypothetical protein
MSVVHRTPCPGPMGNSKNVKLSSCSPEVQGQAGEPKCTYSSWCRTQFMVP